MNLRLAAKNTIALLPEAISRPLVHVPFSMRLGPAYNESQNLIRQHETIGLEEKKAWILSRLKFIVHFAYENSIAYRAIYERAKYHPDKLKNLSYFADVPIVKKSDLREFSIEERSTKTRRGLCLNTGGSSGEPLEFLVDSEAFAREWGHMHWIWKRRGYRHTDLKLTLRGKNLGNSLVRYNAGHNEFIVNSYANKNDVVGALGRLFERQEIKWVHGYPSLVADLFDHVRNESQHLLKKFETNIKGALLGSEFPAPHYRGMIESVIGRNIIAWYGHSEMCVLAFEEEPNRYVPLHTYGYCESCPGNDGSNHLVGTSYWNCAGPFVRYDTEDSIEPILEQELLQGFSIVEGRIGDFVADRNGNRIALTALIFGRHHKAFEGLKHIQVKQCRPGQIQILLVPQKKGATLAELAGGFDLTNVDLDIEFGIIDRPYRTKSGKAPLLVRQ